VSTLDMPKIQTNQEMAMEARYQAEYERHEDDLRDIVEYCGGELPMSIRQHDRHFDLYFTKPPRDRRAALLDLVIRNQTNHASAVERLDQVMNHIRWFDGWEQRLKNEVENLGDLSIEMLKNLVWFRVESSHTWFGLKWSVSMTSETIGAQWRRMRR
jgi:hypothetical protein